MLLEEIKSWNKLPNETDEAYGAFCLYLNMGRRRSLATFVTTIDEAMSIEQLNTWSNTFSWSERIELCERFIQDELLNSSAHSPGHGVTLHKMGQFTSVSHVVKQPRAKYFPAKRRAKRSAH